MMSGLVLIVILFGLTVFLGFSLWGITSLRQGLIEPSGAVLRILLPACLFLFLLVSFRFKPENRAVVALCLIASVASLYLAEGYLEFMRAQELEKRTNLDRRSKIEVIADLRKQGVNAYPVMRAKTLLLSGPDSKLKSVLGDDGFLPLASLPKKRVVSCNEGGSWLTYDSDRHGFNNPDSIWDGASPSLVLLGDSFAHGSCVNPDQNIAGRLGQSFGPTLNLGVSGFGPLSMLAALTEYAQPLRPPIVLWLFFEGNDLTEDMAFERQSPLLSSYLEKPDFSQRLILRHDEITSRLTAYLDQRLTEAMARFDNPNEALLNFLQLFHLRERFGLGILSLGLADTTDLSDQANYFGQVLRQAQQKVEGWGGRLILVYLPESARFFAGEQNGELRRRIHSSVLDTAAKLNLSVIDVTEAFKQDDNPARFFAYPGSHYNETGYGKAAEAISSFLSEQAAKEGAQ
ncbi:MAG: hypothetical protein HQL43_06585 [Alphaproteobacteria bacterium]|nr:hypothetical protein [Alphaproteobacteria bacterium]